MEKTYTAQELYEIARIASDTAYDAAVESIESDILAAAKEGHMELDLFLNVAPGWYYEDFMENLCRVFSERGFDVECSDYEDTSDVFCFSISWEQ